MCPLFNDVMLPDLGEKFSSDGNDDQNVEYGTQVVLNWNDPLKLPWTTLQVGSDEWQQNSYIFYLYYKYLNSCHSKLHITLLIYQAGLSVIVIIQ